MSYKFGKITKYVLVLSLFAVGFVFSINKVKAINYINYYGIEMTNEEYITLLNLGFSEDEIHYMTEETFEENKELDATLLASNTKYYKTVTPLYGNSYTVEVTENEYNSVSDIVPLSIVETTYKRMVGTISKNGSKYRYKVSVSWKSMPSVKSYDIIGIGFTDDVYINSSVYFNFVYADTSGNYTTSTQYYNKKSISTGGAAVYKIPTNIAALSANLYYDVSKDTTNTLTSLTMCADYSHATSAVPVGNVSDYSIGIGGINLGTSISAYYDAMPCALTSASVSW